MRKISIWVFIIVILAVSYWYIERSDAFSTSFSDVEAGFEDVYDMNIQESEPMADPEVSEFIFNYASSTRQSRWAYWWREFSPSEQLKYGNVKREPGPFRVGVQAGHWRNSEVPEELDGLKRNGSGAVGGGKTEAEVVLEIARKVKTALESNGIIVDLLPATVPIDYFADAFVSIHADGNTNPSVSGFKIAPPQRDFSSKSVLLAEILNDTYKKETSLEKDSNVTRRMSAYYVFNWRRYEHALHPMTPAVIIETGFMTNPDDRKIIINNQAKVVNGIVKGILQFLEYN